MGRPLLSGVRTELRCCPAGPAARSARTFRHEGAWIPSCFRTRTDCAQARAPRVMVKTRARQSGTRFCSSPFGDLALRSLHSQHRQCTPSGVAGRCVKMALRFGIAIPAANGRWGERRLGYTRIGRRQNGDGMRGSATAHHWSASGGAEHSPALPRSRWRPTRRLEPDRVDPLLDTAPGRHNARRGRRCSSSSPAQTLTSPISTLPRATSST